MHGFPSNSNASKCIRHRGVQISISVVVFLLLPLVVGRATVYYRQTRGGGGESLWGRYYTALGHIKRESTTTTAAVKTVNLRTFRAACVRRKKQGET